MSNQEKPTEDGLRFLLFINGMSEKSARAIENFKHISQTHLETNFRLEIIDIQQNKEKAVEYQIFAIPTLLKMGPGERRFILGDLSDTSKVLKILDL